MLQSERTNLPKVGMNTDVHPSELTETEYTFARNAVLSGESSEGVYKVQNEASNLLNTRLNDGYYVIGREYNSLNKRCYLFLVNPTTEVSEIGYTEIDTNLTQTDVLSSEGGVEYETVQEFLENITQQPQQEYITLLNDECNGELGFSIEHPFRDGTIVFKKEKCGDVMYFTDNYRWPTRRLALDHIDWYKSIDPLPGESSGTSLTITPPQLEFQAGTGETKTANIVSNLDLDPDVEETCVNSFKLLLRPYFATPCLRPVRLSDGGNLRMGIYEFKIAACDKLGNEYTEYYSATRPVSIFNRNQVVMDATETADRTGLGILLEVEWYDPNVRYYKVVVSQKSGADASTKYYVEGIHPISQKQITHVTDVDKEPISLERLSIIPTRYERTKLLGTSNGYLFEAGLTVEKAMNLQPAMLLLGSFMKWQTVEAEEGLYGDGVLDSLYGSAMRDEVYAYGIRFFGANGLTSNTYILAGRPAESADMAVLNDTNAQSIKQYQNDCFESTRIYTWQFKNTATDLGTVPSETIEFEGESFINEECTVKPYHYGKFGYHESLETYPGNDELFNASKLILPPDTPSAIQTDLNNWYRSGTDSNGNVTLNENADFRYRNIRHFRYPDNIISPFMEVNSKEPFARSKIYPLGLYIEDEVVDYFLRSALLSGYISQEQYEEIEGFEILIGDRTLHRSVIAKGIAYDMYKYKSDSTNEDVYFSNFPYNDLGDDPYHYVSKDDETLISHPFNKEGNNRFTFHSPDIHFRKPNLPNEMVIEGFQRGHSRGVFSQMDEHSKMVILSSDAYKLATNLAVAKALFNTLAQYGDYRVAQVTASGKTHKYGLSGKAMTKTDWNIDLNLNLTNSATGFTAVTGESIILTGVTGPVTGTILVPAINLSSGPGYIRNNNDSNNWIDTGDYKVTTTPGLPIIGEPSASVTGTHGVRIEGVTGNLDSLSTLEKGLILAGVIQGVMSDYSEDRQNWLKIFQEYGDPVNFGYFYTSAGFYNQFITNTQTDSYLRYLTGAYYLPEGMVRPNQGVTTDSELINNVDRETSVYITTADSSDRNSRFKVVYPSVVRSIDNSRFTSGQLGGDYENKSWEEERNILSPYISLKQYLPSQYGQVSSVKWLPTGYCTKFGTRTYHKIFGGDTRIGRFYLKRKVPFYTLFSMRQNRTPFNYSSHNNIGKNVYDINYDFAEITTDMPDNPIWSALLGLITLGWSIIDPATPERKSDYNFDDFNESNYYVKEYSKFYLASYGIPGFLCESDINTNYRYAGRTPVEGFYDQIGDYEKWTQEAYVSIREDNVYKYNPVYSLMPDRVNGVMLPDDFDQAEYDCRYDMPNGVAYGLQDLSEQDLIDPWSILRPLDLYQFPAANGPIIRVKGIESTQVACLFQNQLSIYNAVDQLRDRVDPIAETLGTGGIFLARPIGFFNADNGYAGAQHSQLLSTPYGHFYVDARNGTIMNLGLNAQGLTPVTEGKSTWFRKHLPFKILRSGIEGLSEIDLDFNYSGLGISLGWDSYNDRLLLTKLDYVVKQGQAEGLEYRNGLFFRKGTEQQVPLTDTTVFTDVSYTIAYYPAYGRWCGYQDYKPNFYINTPVGFSTGFNPNNRNGELNSVTIWQHLKTQQSYGVFQGRLYPFEVEFVSRNTFYNNELSHIGYWIDARRYKNEYEYAGLTNIGFGTGFIYNESENTGILEFVPEVENSRRQYLLYPSVSGDTLQILTTHRDKSWHFSQIYNRIIRNNSNIKQILSDENEIILSPNPNVIDKSLRMKDRLRGNYFKVRLSYNQSPYKIITHWFTESLQTP